MTNEQYREYLKSDKWRRIVEKRLAIDGYRCVCCGTAGSTENPLEIHHLSYKNIGEEENRIYEDLETLCHIHHKMIHKCMERQTSPSGRRGWKDSNLVPQLHIFNVSGNDLKYIEEKKED